MQCFFCITIVASPLSHYQLFKAKIEAKAKSNDETET